MKPIRLASGLLIALLPALLAGCGFFDSDERAPWRAQAEAACYARKMVSFSSTIKPSGPIKGKGICGIDRPLRVSALEDGAVSLGDRSLALSCPMTAALQRWVHASVMPAAYARYGSPVVEIKTAGTYNCRSRNNVPGAALSEHAFANAFDFVGVKLANGYTVTMRSGWRGSATDRAFLREITASACGPFTTVLGPGSDGKHEDHLHLDLAHHNARGTYRYCKPRPAVSPSPPMVMAERPPPLAPQAAAPTYTDTLSPDYPAMSAANPAILTTAGSSGFDAPLPPEGMVATAPAPAAIVPAVTQPVATQPAGCPPGYICTPVGSDATTTVDPAPLGWSVGPQPAGGYSDGGYSDGDITGSIGGYSDD